MTSGAAEMLVWCADSWVSLTLVSMHENIIMVALNDCCIKVMVLKLRCIMVDS